MKTLSLALRFLRRDWRSGELRLLALALMVAVAAVTAVSFFTDRVERAMALQAGEILAADLVLSSSNPIPPQFPAKAAALGLESARTLKFPSVVLHGDTTQLVEVKAVDTDYPLRGELRFRTNPGAQEQTTKETPSSGEIWAEARLLAVLDLSPQDEISLGEKRFRVSRVLSRDTGEGSGFLRLGPKVLIALEDIPATGLVTPASRVRHQLLIAGSKSGVDEFLAWSKARLPKGARLEHMSNARPELRNALDRAGRFLGLAALAAVLVAGAAVALSTRRFVERQSDTSAIMRCLGASSRMIFQVLMFRLIMLATFASLLGSLMGYLAQFLLANLLQNEFGSGLPAPGFQPVMIGLGTGLVTLIGFTLPPAVRLAAVPPLRVLRRELGAPPPAAWVVALFSVGAISLLMFQQAGDPTLAVRVLLGTLLATALLLSVSWALVRLLAPLRKRGGTLWRYGLAGLARNPGMTAMQLTGFGLGILAMLLLAIVRLDLLTAWQLTIPEDAPNQFLVNIQPGEVESLNHFLSNKGITEHNIYPMLRARLTHINNHRVSVDDYKDDRAQRLTAREFNLSHSEQMQSDNRIVAGKWWGANDQQKALFSVELDLAHTLGIEIHDLLTFNLAGSEIRGEVTSLRTVKWDSFKPNFFVIGTPGLLNKFPSNYITSFHLPPGREKLLAELVTQFPAVTIIDVTSLMQQIREIISRGSLAVQYVFFFTLGAGLLMLYAGIQASREHRRQESAILRTLGLKRKGLLIAAWVEFSTLGLLAGTLASGCASLTGWLLATEVFGFPFHLNPWVWVIGVFGSAVAIGTAGVLASYPLTIQPPLQTLHDN
ncbi:MAG: FtsX-like permease family protein [Sedimenticola sp.]